MVINVRHEILLVFFFLQYRLKQLSPKMESIFKIVRISWASGSSGIVEGEQEFQGLTTKDWLGNIEEGGGILRKSFENSIYGNKSGFQVFYLQNHQIYTHTLRTVIVGVIINWNAWKKIKISEITPHPQLRSGEYMGSISALII